MSRNVEKHSSGLQRHSPHHQQTPAENNAESGEYTAENTAMSGRYTAKVSPSIKHPKERQTGSECSMNTKTEHEPEKKNDWTSENESEMISERAPTKESEKKSKRKSKKKSEKPPEEEYIDDFHPAECTAALQYFLSDSASVWNKIENIIDETLVKYWK